MAFQFRFPVALRDMIQRDPDCPITFANAIEKAREWALPLEGEKRKKPTLSDTEAYVVQMMTETPYYGEGAG